MEDNIGKHPSKDREFFLFVSADETVIFHAKGIFNKIIEGDLLLTDKKLFFYFWSNISRDKVFIATYPFLILLTGSSLRSPHSLLTPNRHYQARSQFCT